MITREDASNHHATYLHIGNVNSKLTSTTIINFLLLYLASRRRTWKVSRLRIHWTPAYSILKFTQATLHWARTLILTPILSNSLLILITNHRYNHIPVSILIRGQQYHLQDSKNSLLTSEHQNNFPMTFREMAKEDNLASSLPTRNYLISRKSTTRLWADCKMRSTCDQLRCRAEEQPRGISVI